MSIITRGASLAIALVPALTVAAGQYTATREELEKILERPDQVQGLLEKGQGAVEGFHIMFEYSKIWNFCAKDNAARMTDSIVEDYEPFQCCAIWHTAAPHVAAVKVVLPWLSDLEEISSKKGFETQTTMASYVAGKIISEQNENLSKALEKTADSALTGAVQVRERAIRR
ncbi:hypothetical protein CN151_32410 [Sinorhizobium meliloti]|uniref:hypothetical protein n=1 Tax=Rhizobium meliloti TaxID=382 RepID=UPI0002A561F0|nr:hypothetical protein [Sinorhizobium meliloti]AGA07297.1 hypothetical protein C770_GR4Chr2374 [Sinorhizobium meliloti GR4]RVK92422.1 hypothetical protein CN151_32410 [Sinorhizobium meliloti]RVM84335.1 hypothetical protein CN119_32390 [Sinorhizobium meliloti]RVM99632.1 hypothetical protein CN112_34545 [Sinorhizobium meliloti]